MLIAESAGSRIHGPIVLRHKDLSDQTIWVHIKFYRSAGRLPVSPDPENVKLNFLFGAELNYVAKLLLLLLLLLLSYEFADEPLSMELSNEGVVEEKSS
jgi:hypothetical protein